MEPEQLLSSGTALSDGGAAPRFDADSLAAAIRAHAPLGGPDHETRLRASPRRGDDDLNPGMIRKDAETLEKLRQAAVLVPLVAREAGLSVLLTRRSPDLAAHSGQIAFPGGGVEEVDDGPVDTALREAEEEVGLARGRVEVLGQLDSYLTRTGFLVQPVVGLVHPPFDLVADPLEVAEIFEVPLDFILDPRNQRMESRTYKGHQRWFYVFPYQDYYIWGATAGMLVNLVEVLRR